MILAYLRTILLYLLLLTVIRMMGKRQIGQMEPSEFVVTMLAANLAAIPMEDVGIPLYAGVIPMLTVLGVELLLSGMSMGSIRFRRLLCGKPVILIENGKVVQSNLRRTRVTIDELMGHLREKEVLDLTTVQYAILETNGNLSVFPYPAHLPATARDAGVPASPQFLPMTLVEDGVILQENLKKSGKDQAWLRRVLGEHRASLDGTWLLMVDQSDRVVWLGKEPG